jgi:hypothetical protein
LIDKFPFIRQFSQTSTNALQSTLSALKTRHAATLSTLTSTSYSLASNVRSAENTVERLRTSLDELGRDIMKETYGRRREVALRVKQLGREEKMLEELRRWLRKGEEAVSDVKSEGEASQSRVRAALLGMTQDARILLETLDDGLVTDSASLSGSLARVVLAQGLADGLVEELKMETGRRMALENAILQEVQDASPPTMLNGSDINHQSIVSDEQENSPNVSSSSAILPHLEVITVHPPESQPEEAQPNTPIPLDSASSDPTALDTPSATTRDDPIPSDSADDTVTTVNEHSPPSFQIHQSDSNQAPAAVFPESAAAEPLSVDVQLTLPIPDIVIDTDVAQPPHICPETVLEEETDDAFQNDDLLVGPSDPVVIELGPGAELVIDDSTSSASPHSPSDLHSVVDPAVPSTSVTPPPTTVSSTGQLSVLAEQEAKIPTPHPLLAELAKISHRYDDFQRSFRDCHLALEALKASLGPSNNQFNRPTGAKPAELTLTPIIPIDIFYAAVSRLDDYTEDVRVEVEIRISDEEVLAKGYEVLLCVPGALHSSSSAPEPSPLSSSLQDDQRPRQLHRHQSHHSPPSQSYGEDQDLEDSSSLPPTQSELEIQVQAFITGTDPSVAKACESFSKKLEDVQHDIAILKRAIHDPDPEMMMDDGPFQTPTTPETGGRGWSSWIRSPSGPPFSASAATASAKHFGALGPSPTFGSIMTSPHQRSSSATFVNGNESSWMQGGGGGRRGGKDDILGRLGLRVPMPIFDSAVHQPVPPLSSSSGWGWNGLSPTMPTPIKQRSVSSTMYMLGLGASPMMTAARSRGTSNSSTGLQKGDNPRVAVGVGVESVSEMPLGGPVSLPDVRRGDKFISVNVGHETTDTETEDEQDVDVE